MALSAAGDAAFSKGDPATSLYVLISGRIRIVGGSTSGLLSDSPGSLGESATAFSGTFEEARRRRRAAQSDPTTTQVVPLSEMHPRR